MAKILCGSVSGLLRGEVVDVQECEERRGRHLLVLEYDVMATQ